MFYLKNVEIKGNRRYVERVRKLFGDLYFGNIFAPYPDTLSLKAFRNNPGYSGVYPKMWPHETRTKKLFVLVPPIGVEVTAVWCDSVKNVSRVRYGKTSPYGRPGPGTRVVSIQLRDGTGLLFCLDHSINGIAECDSFGV
jgi:hypothetical protein